MWLLLIMNWVNWLLVNIMSHSDDENNMMMINDHWSCADVGNVGLQICSYICNLTSIHLTALQSRKIQNSANSNKIGSCCHEEGHQSGIWHLFKRMALRFFRTTDQFIRRHIMLPFPSLEQLLQRIKGKTRFSKIKKLSNWVVEIRI